MYKAAPITKASRAAVAPTLHASLSFSLFVLFSVPVDMLETGFHPLQHAGELCEEVGLDFYSLGSARQYRMDERRLDTLHTSCGDTVPYRNVHFTVAL